MVISMKNNYLNLVGLAYRAGKCSLGEETIVKDIKQRRAKLVLLANDIGPQTRKKITDKCTTYEVQFAISDDRETISHAIDNTKRLPIDYVNTRLAYKLN